MIDIRGLRDDPEGVRAALAHRGVDAAEVDAVRQADVEHRARLARAEALRAEVKDLSRQVGAARKAGALALAEELSEQSKRVGVDARAAAAAAEVEGERVHQALLYLPNIP